MICNYVKEIALIIRQNKQILPINQMLLQYCTNKVNCKNIISNTYATQFCNDYKCLTPLKQNKTIDE